MANFTTSTQIQQQTPVYTPEALQALMADYDRLRQMLALLSGQHQGLFGFLSGQQPLGQSLLGAPTKQAMSLARGAVRGAGQEAGLGERSLGNVDADLRAQTPDKLSPLGLWAQQYARGMDSLIDPRFAQFYQPHIAQSQEVQQSGANQATNWLATAGQLANIAGSFL